MPDIDTLRSYRLRIFDGNYEVLHKRPVLVDLDLGSPITPAILDRYLVRLTRAARVYENEPMDMPRLEVWDVLDGQKVRDIL
jgi:hypothetical protein